MAEKTSTDVLIRGKVYTLSGNESVDYLQKVAAYINEKDEEMASMDSYRHLTSETKSALLDLNIAHDYFKADMLAGELKKSLEEKEQELYSIKHDIIELQLKLEEAQKTIAKNESEIKELKFNKNKLEESLKDVLLGNNLKNDKKADV
ncbi:cell division protein ZapA [Acetitomaculum ruminis DSM 5522]|uniref:Cell division protein ZapA n=1 Tax=Acetitomaculum ruminis DSM 5522 TaxID=1120918 RepID=A0A1I0VJ76_9FIRM|nr:cell division protein ZapA [Acetitomaculum ruminis]SFA76073.1 cell division protein ZapA [Acetitomaculum ruminis DSM 5522]